MGKLILCNGVKTTKAYVFEATNTRIYSIEELSYYIYNNVYYLDSNFIKNSLIDWIGTNLKLDELSEKLQYQHDSNENYKTMIMSIFSYSNLYTGIEIKTLLNTIDDLIKMTPIQRRCYRANRFLDNKRYDLATKEYEKIIQIDEINAISKEEYGDILHNLAVAMINYIGLEQGMDYFIKAYELNNKNDSLLSYLYCVLIYKGRDRFWDEIEKHRLDIAIADSIVDYFDTIYNEANLAIDFERKDINNILDEWKTELRK
ncbi:MAG TPA: hypothetical protein GXZ90_08495 [Clostridiales bacterium]|nr:hypothetical protein [Clostridiales bacterium]